MTDNLGIVDTKKIISAIHESYGLDLRDFNLTTLRRRFAHLLSFYNTSVIDDFVNDIQNNNIDKEEFIEQLLIETTELFRDPSLWRELREKYLPEISATAGSKIWMAGITTGEELYSLMILLKEYGFADKLRVVASCASQRMINSIKAGGNYDMKKMEVGIANYARFSGNEDFTKYYKLAGTKAVMDTSLISNVEFNTLNVSQEDNAKTYRMVIFRNILIQYNLPLYEKAIRRLTNSLTVGGYLILGNKESLEHSEVGKKMQLVNEAEKIYRKRFD